MKLDENEFTKRGLVEHLNEKFGGKSINKVSDERKNRHHKNFTTNDINQYINYGHLPGKYGGQGIRVDRSTGVPILILSPVKTKKSNK